MEVPNQFAGLLCAMIEAANTPLPPKRIKELAKDIIMRNPEVFPGGWVESGVPFAFSSNSRNFLKDTSAVRT